MLKLDNLLTRAGLLSWIIYASCRPYLNTHRQHTVFLLNLMKFEGVPYLILAALEINCWVESCIRIRQILRS